VYHTHDHRQTQADRVSLIDKTYNKNIHIYKTLIFMYIIQSSQMNSLIWFHITWP